MFKCIVVGKRHIICTKSDSTYSLHFLPKKHPSYIYYSSSSTFSITFAFLLRPSISPSSNPFWNSSGIFFNSFHAAASFPATSPAERVNSVSLVGPMRKMAAIPIIASSAGPRPKREWSWVDDELDRIMADDPSRRRFGDNNDG